MTGDATTAGALDGLTALVTGAASGIGAGIARVLAGRGAQVAVTDLDGDGAEETAAELPGTAVGLTLDVTDGDSVTAGIEAVLDRWGRLDVLVCNAGVPADPERESEFDRDEDWDRTLEVNVKGTARCCRAAVEPMRQAGGGRIITVASMAGHAQRRTGGAYAASKAAVLRFTKGLAARLAADDITVNAVCPGAVWTEFQRRDMAAVRDADPDLADASLQEVFETTYADVIPLGRPQTPADVGAAVAFLASDDARNITGQCLHVDGGAVLRD